MDKAYNMDVQNPAKRALHTAAVLAVRGIIVVALSSVVLMTRLWPGFVTGRQ